MASRLREVLERAKTKPEVRMPDCACPHCGKVQDAASGLSSHYPEPGDISVCFDCAGVSVFGENGARTRWPEDEPMPQELLDARRIVLESLK